jgi:sortase A
MSDSPMRDRRPVDELTTKELERILAIRKRQERHQRLRRLDGEGRLVGVESANGPPPPPLPRPHVEPSGATNRYLTTPVDEPPSRLAMLLDGFRLPRWRFPSVNLRWVMNRFLLLIELAAVLGLAYTLWDAWQTRQELNREVAEAQHQVIEEEFPTPGPTPIIGVVLLPGGHTSPISEGGARPGEAGGIPEHLLPLVTAYEPPPVPTPGPEQARRITIPAINVDHPVVQGDDWEQLKKGVGQHIGSADPGIPGNLVLTAHNDIYGEIFRHLDQLEVGDEIVVHTLSRQYVYVVQSQRIVEPSDVSVLAVTRKPTITLISCYPYLVDTQRIVIIGALKEEL